MAAAAGLVHGSELVVAVAVLDVVGPVAVAGRDIAVPAAAPVLVAVVDRLVELVAVAGPDAAGPAADHVVAWVAVVPEKEKAWCWNASDGAGMAFPVAAAPAAVPGLESGPQIVGLNVAVAPAKHHVQAAVVCSHLQVAEQHWPG